MNVSETIINKESLITVMKYFVSIARIFYGRILMFSNDSFKELWFLK